MPFVVVVAVVIDVDIVAGTPCGGKGGGISSLLQARVSNYINYEAFALTQANIVVITEKCLFNLQKHFTQEEKIII